MEETPKNDNIKSSTETLPASGVPTLRNIWVCRVAGGVGGLVLSSLAVLIPVMNTWLANSREVALAQTKVAAEQIAYTEKRMQDSDKERDIYKREMLECQQQLRDLRK